MITFDDDSVLNEQNNRLAAFWDAVHETLTHSKSESELRGDIWRILNRYDPKAAKVK